MRKRISLSLPEDLVKAIDKEAEAQQRNRSNMAEVAFSEYLASLEVKNEEDK